MTAMTAGGKASGSDSAPLELSFADGIEMTGETRVRIYRFLQSFFNTTIPERVLLDEKYSRLVHGGHTIGLYYHLGFRSAWYLLRKGDRLNQPGDTNPFPQAFIFIDGEGSAKIGDRTVNVRAGESYYIPPGSDHVVWTESDRPLVLIWLAWGDGA
jgi:mannose-6-phosphate isomerase-like protein (cupin superfamily)